MSSSSTNNTHSFKKIQNGVEFNISAPGKVILHGEHSVVYGKLAVAASLGLRTKIHLMEIDLPDTLVLKLLPLDFEHSFNLADIQAGLLDNAPTTTKEISEFNWEYPNLIDHQKQLEAIEETDIFKAFLSDKNNLPDGAVIKAVKCMFYLLSGILSSAKVSLKPMCIIIDSELSMGAGTGSSASLSVAISALFTHYLKVKTLILENISKAEFKPFIWDKRDLKHRNQISDRELEKISNWAFNAEKIFHGTPSGIDNTVCTYGNLVKFRKDHSTTHIYLNSPLNLLLINTKVPRETMNMVSRVSELKKSFPHVVEHILDALESLTVSALEIIDRIDEATAGGDTDIAELNCGYWGTLIQMNHSLLSSLGVSHEKLDEINMILAKHGLKGKLTGAGGGGYAISLISPSYDPEEVIRKLKEHDFSVVETELGGPGVRVD